MKTIIFLVVFSLIATLTLGSSIPRSAMLCYTGCKASHMRGRPNDMREYLTCVRACSETPGVNRFYTKEEYAALYDEEVEEDVAVESDKIGEEKYGLLDQQKIWDQYRHELVKVLTRGNKNAKHIQVFSIPEDADWDENPAKFKEICDRVPYWDQYYSKSPYHISTQYKRFVENINAGNKIVDQGSYAELQKQLDAHAQVEGKLRTAKRACYRQYAADSTSLPLDKYMDTKCAAYKQAKSELSDMAAFIEFYTALAYGTENAALHQVRNEIKGGLMEYHEAGVSLGEFRKMAAKGQGTSLKFHVTHFTSTEKTESYKGYAKGLKRPSSLNGGFFSQLTASGNGITTKSEEFKMDVSFKSYRRINIAPNDWFRMDVLRKYKNGPFIHGSPNLFGKGGSMRLLPTAIYVAYQPTFKLHVNKKDAFNFKNSKNLGKSGFFSSKKTTYSVDTQFKSSDEYIVTLSTTSKVPQVIAMDFAPLP